MMPARNFTGTASRSDSTSGSVSGGPEQSVGGGGQTPPTVLLIRHAETELNEEKRLRSWVDVDISEKGRQETMQTAQALGNVPVSQIFHSDLSRAEQTSEILANQFFVPNTPMRELRPWDVGKYSQFKLEEVQDELNSYIKNPRKKIPGGESFGDFEARWREGFQNLVAHAMQGQVVAGVTHSRNIATTESWLRGGEHDPKHILNADSVPPSGVMAITVQDGRLIQIPFGNEHLQKDE